MLYSSHLEGMERPVQSFKSFIRTTPSRASPNKPLPPIIPTLQEIPSSSSVATANSQSRSTGFSLWEAPSNWDNSDQSQVFSTSPFALRQYSPLIPEPPEDIAAMQADPALWQLGNGPFPQTALDPIHERNAVTPEIPARNPSRLSLSKPVSTTNNSRSSLPSVSSRYSTGANDEGLLEDVSETGSDGQPGNDLPSSLDLVTALSDMKMEEKAFNSLGLGSSRDQGIVWGGQPQRSDSLQLEDDAHLDLQGNKLTTFRKGSLLADDSPVSPEDPDMSNKMQALSFAQDYHNILADRVFDDHAQLEHTTPLKMPPKDRDLTPQPLAWRKESSGSPPTGLLENPQLPPNSSSGQSLGRHKNLRKMSSWVSYHFRKDSHTGTHQGSTSNSDALPQPQVSESEDDRHLKKDARLTNIVQHGRDFIARKVQRRATEPHKPLIISSPLPQHSNQAPDNPSVSAAPLELPTPLFRLPGGLSIVRESPLSTPRPHTAGEPPASPSSPSSDLSWSDFPVSSLFHFDFPRRSSCQSENAQVQSPVVAIKHKLRSLGSSSSLRAFSYSTTSLATPSQGAFPSYSPPQARRRSHNVGSPLTAPPFSHGVEQRSDDSVEEPTNKLNLFEKAKNARDAWKKLQQEIKKERLKQIIILVESDKTTEI